MQRQETFFWYDLETFGLDPRYDRIAQFAGVRTDYHLTVVEDPVVLYCKLSDDYLPDPLACMLTGITPQMVEEKGLVESEFIERVNEAFSKPKTCVAGYNTLRFDDEFIRNALFRNFLDPYRREWDRGNSRWDIIDLARAAHDLRPEGIVWPVKEENGNPSFKLDDLAEANGIAHTEAHDALSDVKATLEIARLIKKRQPKLFDYYLSLRDKQTAKRMLSVPMGEPVLLTAATYTRAQGCTTIVVPITAIASNSNSIVVFDLAQDPEELIEASQAYSEVEQMRTKAKQFRSVAAKAMQAVASKDDMAESLEEAARSLSEASDVLDNFIQLLPVSNRLFHTKGISKVALNRAPFVSPLNVLTDEIADRLHLDRQVCLQRYQRLLKYPQLAVHLRQAAEEEEYPRIDDVDFSLYSGSFFSDADYKRFATIRKTLPEKLGDLTITFDDNRCYEMLWRYRCRNWPETLDEEQQERWKSFCAQRLIQPPGATPVDIAFYARKIAERMASKETLPKEKEILAALEAWGHRLCERVGITYPR